jgi:hypothetical protein
MKATRRFVAIALLLGGCAQSHGIPEPLPDVPRDTRLGELTDEQFRELCDWLEGLAGGEEYLTCADGSMIGRFDPVACYELRVYYTPECPGTVGHVIECRTTMVNECLASGPDLEPIPACERAGISMCPEP